MEIPSVTKIQSKILSDFRTELGITVIKPNSFLYVFSFVLAGALYGFYYFAEKLINNLFLDTTTDEKNIEQWGNFLGLGKKEGSNSEGIVEVTGNGTIPKGTILTNSLGDEYEVKKEVTITKGSGMVSVASRETGKDKNISSGQLMFQGTVKGIEPIATIKEGGIVGGCDAELMEDYRQRLLYRVRTIQTGGNRQDYINWVSTVPGVGKVFVFENSPSLGKVSISYITNDRDNLFPTDADPTMQKVRNVIKNYKPFGAEVQVFIPIKRKIYLIIKLITKPGYDVTTVRGNVENQLKEMFKRNADMNGIVYFSKISEAISLAEGEESHEWNASIDTELGKRDTVYTDIQLGEREIAVLGDIEWSNN